MTDAPEMRSVPFRLIEGRGGAADGSGDSVISAQAPHFAARGLDLSGFHMATLNLDLSPRRFEVRSPRLTLRDIRWRPGFAGEDYAFCAAAVEFGDVHTHALVYHQRLAERAANDEETRRSVVRVLAPFIEGVAIGDMGAFWYDPAEIWVGD